MTNRRTLHRSTSGFALLAACASGVAGCSGDYALGDLSEQEQRLTETTASSAPSDTNVAAALRPPDVSFGIEPQFTFEPPMLATADLDGDGFDDIAMREYDVATRTQYVHIRYGGPRPAADDAAGEEFDSRAGDFILGQSGARLVLDSIDVPLEDIAPAGDIDGDGYGDLLIALQRCEPTQANEGVYLLYGGPERLTDLTFLDEAGTLLSRPPVGSSELEGFFCSTSAATIAGVGDLDGDGLDDFVLADPPVQLRENAPPETADRTAEAYLFYGRAERITDGTAWVDADATLVSSFDLRLAPAGDIDADGLSDLFVGSDFVAGTNGFPTGLALLRGRAERLSGTLQLDAVAQRIEGATIAFTAPYPATADLDGDGVNDVFMNRGADELRLFYGAPGLFAEGVDIASAAAIIPTLHGFVKRFLPAGDLDGDGDGDLVAQFDAEQPDYPFATDVAVLSGGAARRAGQTDFPFDEVRAARPFGMFGTDWRAIDTVLRAGDLDGDGAADLITASTEYVPLFDEFNTFSGDLPMLHIHYGTPGGTSATPLR